MNDEKNSPQKRRHFFEVSIYEKIDRLTHYYLFV